MAGSSPTAVQPPEPRLPSPVGRAQAQALSTLGEGAVVFRPSSQTCLQRTMFLYRSTHVVGLKHSSGARW